MSEKPPYWAYVRVREILGWHIMSDYVRKAEYSPVEDAFATYIAQHEEAPVDHLYEALKAVVELGRYDTREQTELLRSELAQRGLQVVEIGKGATDA